MAAHALRQLTVADAMVTQPVVHPPATTVRELRVFFADDHVHLALVVAGDELLGTVERADLALARDDANAAQIAQLVGRTVRPEAPAVDALDAMRRAGRRRLAVTSSDQKLIGLLCLKASGDGFCSDEDVAARRLFKFRRAR
jgi:CBS domain-containing protein